MGTIDSPKIVKTILENNGTYPGDPQCYGVYCYRNTKFSKWCFSLEYSQEGYDSLVSSPVVRLVIPLWIQTEGLTRRGRDFLAGRQYHPDI